MRLDKYLKVSRILKRRTISKELAENGRIVVNGRVAKPATTINVGDKIEVVFGQRHLVVEVLGLENTVKKQEADSLYQVIKEFTVGDEDEEK